MANATLKNAKITALSVVLGENERHFENEPLWWDENEQKCKKLQKAIGFGRTYEANPNTTMADLAEVAARELLNALNVSELDAILCITQTPDYAMPGNAHILHARLGLGKGCAAFDLEFGCSGFVFGLFNAFSMINSGFKRVLLVCGDTILKAVNKKDKATAPIFSDAASACLVEFDESAGESFFVLKSDGRGLSHLCKKAGAYKMPSSKATRKEIADENGNVRSDENLYMDGAEVFNFTLIEQPPLLDEILAYAGLKKEGIDFFILHQANSFIVQSVARKAGLPSEKVLDIFAEFGNQNSASIPTAICTRLGGEFSVRKKLLMQGFGIGLSWGACVVDFENVLCLKPQIYKGEKDDKR